MKKIWNLLFVAAIVGGLVGCGDTVESTGSSNCAVVLKQCQDDLEKLKPEEETEVEGQVADYELNEAARIANFRFTSAPREGYHNTNLNVGYTGARVSSIVLEIIRYTGVSADRTTFSSEVVDRFNLYNHAHGVLIYFERSGTDTTLHVEEATSSYKGKGLQIAITQSRSNPTIGDIDLKIISNYTWEHTDTENFPRFSKSKLLIVGMDDARDGGFVTNNQVANLGYGWFNLYQRSSGIQIKHLQLGAGTIEFKQRWNSRVGGTYINANYYRNKLTWGRSKP